MSQSQEREGQGGEKGNSGSIGNRPGRSNRHRTPLVPGKQLGGLHMVHAGPRRLIEGELVPKSPREDTQSQGSQSYGQNAQCWALVSQSSGLWDGHRTLGR